MIGETGSDSGHQATVAAPIEAAHGGRGGHLTIVTRLGAEGNRAGEVQGGAQGLSLMRAMTWVVMIGDMTTTAPTVEEQHRLTRPRDGRIVAGVCRGAGAYFDVDPVVFRVTLAVLTFFGGVGVVIYGIGWLLIPEPEAPSTWLEGWLEGHSGDRRRGLLIVAAAVVVLLLLVNGRIFGGRFFDAFLLVVISLAVVTVVNREWGRWRDNRTAGRRDRVTDPVFGPVNSPAEYAAASAAPSATSYATAPPAAVWVPPPPRRRRERSWLGLLIVGFALVTAGVMSLLAVIGVAHPQPADVVAACVGVVGVGLVVGAFAGRAWLMIVVGFLLVGCLAIAAALPRNLTWTAGTRTWTPVTAPAGGADYVLGAGNATLDLRELPRGVPALVTSRVGAGQLRIVAPLGRPLVVHAHSGAGQVVIFGDEHDGLGADYRHAYPGIGTTQDVLTLDVSVGYGQVEVVHEAP